MVVGVRLLPPPPIDFRLLNFVRSPGLNQGRSFKCEHLQCFDIDEIEDATCPVCKCKVEKEDFYIDYQVSRMVKVLDEASSKLQKNPEFKHKAVCRLLDSLQHVQESVELCPEYFLDPWTSKPIRTPVKGGECEHQNCFDFHSFVATFQSHLGKCPFEFCRKQLSLSSLVVSDGFFAAFAGREEEDTGWENKELIDVDDVESDSEPYPLREVKVEQVETPASEEADEDQVEKGTFEIHPRDSARLKGVLRESIGMLANVRDRLQNVLNEDITTEEEYSAISDAKGALNEQLLNVLQKVVLAGSGDFQVSACSTT